MGDQAAPSSSFELNAADLIDHFYELWVAPELTRRGLALARDEITRVLIEMFADRAPRVMINDEAEIAGNITLKPGFVINPGDDVYADQIESFKDLKPITELHPDSGWVCFATVAGIKIVNFDFTYNRGRARVLLSRAHEFLSVARHALTEMPAVAVDTALSAAELSVHAQMISMTLETKQHWRRREWLQEWVELDNAPKEHAHTLARLTALRGSARYGDGPLELEPDWLSSALDVVDDMIGTTEQRLGVRES